MHVPCFGGAAGALHLGGRPGAPSSGGGGGFPIPGLVAYWRFADTLADAVGAANGTATGAAYAAGKHGKGYVLTGSNLITIPNIVSPQMSFFGWLFKVNDYLNAGIATKSSIGGSQGDWALGFFSGSSNSLLTARLNNNALTVIGQPVSSGAWHHVGFTYDQISLKTFCDGARSGLSAFTDPITNTASQIVMGTYYDTGHTVEGIWDEAAYFNRGITEAEVATLYAGGAGLFY